MKLTGRQQHFIGQTAIANMARAMLTAILQTEGFIRPTQPAICTKLCAKVITESGLKLSLSGVNPELIIQSQLEDEFAQHIRMG